MNWLQPKTYAVKHQDENIRAASRSGGVFTALSDNILEEGGVVYGCILTESFTAVHVRADSLDARDKMRGSKYIQSRLGDTFRNVKADLDDGKKVLFSGTSCQVAGLKNFLGKEYASLLCVDIVCHSVPSKAVWKKYLEWQEQKNNGKLISVNFRNKKDFGWHSHVETLCFDNGKKVNSSIFKTLFLGHNISRPSCYECPFKAVTHPGDITIADYWGIEKAAPGFDDNKGVSLVLINNEKGELIFDKVRDSLDYKSTRIEDSLQPALKEPFPAPKTRAQFWSDFQSRDFSYVAAKYGGYGFINEAKKFLGKIKRRILK